MIFLLNDTATTKIYTLSLHDALPIYAGIWISVPTDWDKVYTEAEQLGARFTAKLNTRSLNTLQVALAIRSEEHTSELQSHSDLVCRLLLEKKKHLMKLILIVIKVVNI